MRERGSGQVRWNNGRASGRVPLGPPFGRRTFALSPTLTTEEEAAARLELLASYAKRLRAAGQLARGVKVLEELAAVESPRAVKAAKLALEVLLGGEAVAPPTGGTTFGELAKQWTTGELARLYPDHVPTINHESNVYRLDKHILPIVGPVPVAAFEGPAGLDYAQAVMRSPTIGKGSRRHVAQILHRLLSIAVFPLRLLAAHPLPRGFLPKPGKAKAKACLYPDEDRKLLGCAANLVPLVDRVTYGFLHREGMRASEAALLERSDLDLIRGAVALDKNKTDDPRAWALRPDTARALRAWFALRDAEGDRDPRVFPRSFDHAADRYREHLEAAGIERPQLFEQSAERMRVRFHDTRSTFITCALANGKTEAWIADRSGHKSSDQINRYRRAARTFAELELGDLAPMDAAIPELVAPNTAATPPPATTSAAGSASSPASSTPASSTGAAFGPRSGPPLREGARTRTTLARTAGRRGISARVGRGARIQVPAG
jgi:integrase